MDKKQLVAALRELMKQNQVDAVYITGCDPQAVTVLLHTGV